MPVVAASCVHRWGLVPRRRHSRFDLGRRRGRVVPVEHGPHVWSRTDSHRRHFARQIRTRQLTALTRDNHRLDRTPWVIAANQTPPATVALPTRGSIVLSTKRRGWGFSRRSWPIP